MTVVYAVRMHLLVHLKVKEREREKGGDTEGKRGGVREGERMREDESELAALQLTTSVASNCGRTIGVSCRSRCSTAGGYCIPRTSASTHMSERRASIRIRLQYAGYLT